MDCWKLWEFVCLFVSMWPGDAGRVIPRAEPPGVDGAGGPVPRHAARRQVRRPGADGLVTLRPLRHPVRAAARRPAVAGLQPSGGAPTTSSSFPLSYLCFFLSHFRSFLASSFLSFDLSQFLSFFLTIILSVSFCRFSQFLSFYVSFFLTFDPS